MELFQLNINDITEDEVAEVARRLPQRYAKAQKFAFENGRKSSLGVGILLLHAFPNLTEADIYWNEYGKMFITNGKEFSVSHSGEYVVLVTDDNPIGVDIEKISNRHLSVAEKVFTESERNWMNENPQERFFTLWTLKESVVKALGVGLSRSLQSFDVLNFTNNQSINVDKIEWFGKTKIIGNYAISIVARNSIKTEFCI